jgi:hypothetical protein
MAIVEEDKGVDADHLSFISHNLCRYQGIQVEKPQAQASANRAV